ncbi:hypothetical protein CR162_10200 [Pseudoroseomonas rhizosphaerae]|uniref:Uncharacterized protein n=1 Tax=Teichococcus rhizosphaerae TaxID=1335062 RepID=A0A2C7A4W8_9PROT|nr:hypothetical protein [Pseudoroseomonas rhizosphaerae]PHK95108.1 hypothetical protein CR162_10200 [Pseudoroseomonas rhizosphaerae]
MSKAHMPPVPPANRPKGPGGAAETPEQKSQQQARPQDNVPQHQGRSDNLMQNTRNQGHQQDR